MELTDTDTDTVIVDAYCEYCEGRHEQVSEETVEYVIPSMRGTHDAGGSVSVSVDAGCVMSCWGDHKSTIAAEIVGGYLDAPAELEAKADDAVDEVNVSEDDEYILIPESTYSGTRYHLAKSEEKLRVGLWLLSGDNAIEPEVIDIAEHVRALYQSAN